DDDRVVPPAGVQDGATRLRPSPGSHPGPVRSGGAGVTNPATSTIPSAPTRGRAATVLLIAGFVLAAFNMRPALAGISPLLGQIMADTGLSAAGAGAITTVMVVCLGVLAPVAPLLSARVGLDRTLLAGLLILTSGVVLRSLDGLAGLYLGAAVAGMAIAIMNVIMPAVVKQHFP